MRVWREEVSDHARKDCTARGAAAAAAALAGHWRAIHPHEEKDSLVVVVAVVTYPAWDASPERQVLAVHGLRDAVERQDQVLVKTTTTQHTRDRAAAVRWARASTTNRRQASTHSDTSQ